MQLANLNDVLKRMYPERDLAKFIASVGYIRFQLSMVGGLTYRRRSLALEYLRFIERRNLPVPTLEQVLRKAGA